MKSKKMQEIIQTVNSLRMTDKEKAALIRQCRDGNTSALFVVNAKRKQYANA